MTSSDSAATGTPAPDDFQAGLAYLRVYVEQEGHARVPANHLCPDGFELGRWAAIVRARRGVGTVPAQDCRALDDLGFIWSGHELRFQRGLAALRAFVAEHGHARVPHHYCTADGLALGNWVSTRRVEYKDGKLKSERVKALEKAGLEWRVRGTG